MKVYKGFTPSVYVYISLKSAMEYNTVSVLYRLTWKSMISFSSQREPVDQKNDSATSILYLLLSMESEISSEVS